MSPLLQLVKFSTKRTQSHSVLVDFQQYYVRNFILFCTGLSMVRLLFGENIICQVSGQSVSQSFIDTKCYINGTMTTPPTFYHDYYQWISVYLLLLAYAFYFPYSIWCKVTGDYLRDLENLADKPNDAIQVLKDSKGDLIYFKTWALEWFYFGYLFIIGYLTDMFFNNGWSLSKWSWNSIYKIFPDNGKCFVFYYESGGSNDAWYNCLLPLCSVYRKIFGTLYGLFFMLIFLNIIVHVYRIYILQRKRKLVNMWWAFKVVQSSTTSWNKKKKLDEFWYKPVEKNFYTFEDLL